MTLQSEIAGILWPPITSAREAPLEALLQQLIRLETASATDIRDGQALQLQALDHHLSEHSPLHRQRKQAAGFSPHQHLTLENLHRLPLLRRRDLQAAGAALFCTNVPPSHLPLSETRTSGSSGEPVVVRRTQVCQLFWLVCTMREHQWWQRDLGACLAVVRANLAQPRISQDSWGAPASLLGPTGPAHAFAMSLDTTTLARELAQVEAQYLLIYPTVLQDLVRHFREEGGGLPALKQIRTLGETLSDDLRHSAQTFFGVDLVDTYSSQELGVIAIQCPVSNLYHVMAENLIVEVLDPQGRPCEPGEIGEVVISDLHNFATPLVRYAIGDHAEVGPRCSCPRQLPTLRRIVGRSRNMVLYPNGNRRWPRVGFDRYREVAPVQQYQLVQHGAEAIEVRLVVERPLTDTEQAALGRVIQHTLDHPFNLTFRYYPDQLPKGAGGKFEEFMRTFEP